MSVQSLTMRVWKTKEGRTLLTEQGDGSYSVQICQCSTEELLALREAIAEATGIAAGEEGREKR